MLQSAPKDTFEIHKHLHLLQGLGPGGPLKASGPLRSKPWMGRIWPIRASVSRPVGTGQAGLTPPCRLAGEKMSPTSYALGHTHGDGRRTCREGASVLGGTSVWTGVDALKQGARSCFGWKMLVTGMALVQTESTKALPV